MTFQIQDNFELPALQRAPGGGRGRGEFALTVDKLEIGQGFPFKDKRELKALYPTCSPAKFEGKKFQIRKIADKDENGEYTYGIRRVAVVAKAESTAVNTATETPAAGAQDGQGFAE